MIQRIPRARYIVSLTALLAASAACPADLEDPDRFLSNDSKKGACASNIDVPKLLAKRCGTADCHEKNDPASKLDLVSAGISKRLIGKASVDCKGKTLVDKKNPSNSYFFDKMEKSHPACGSAMPVTGDRMTATELACIRAWLGIGPVTTTDGGSTSSADSSSSKADSKSSSKDSATKSGDGSSSKRD